MKIYCVNVADVVLIGQIASFCVKLILVDPGETTNQNALNSLMTHMSHPLFGKLRSESVSMSNFGRYLTYTFVSRDFLLFYK